MVKNIDPSMKFRTSCGDLGLVLPCLISDEELGLGDLHRILPDTWANTPWGLQKAIDILRVHHLDIKKDNESLKKYTIDSLKAVMNSTFEYIQEDVKDKERLSLDTKQVKDALEDGLGDMKKMYNKKLDDMNEKIENLDVKLFNRME